jgi:hypothetical protein
MDEISQFEITGIFGISTFSSALLGDGLLITWYKIQAFGILFSDIPIPPQKNLVPGSFEFPWREDLRLKMTLVKRGT